VVFFDGVCALCNASVRFLIRVDGGGILRFAPLQGEVARGEPRLAGLRPSGGTDPESLVYLRGAGSDARVLTRSDALLAVLADLGGFWRVVAWSRILPRALRDWAYDVVARHRYGWFGRLDACPLPEPDQAWRFLD